MIDLLILTRSIHWTATVFAAGTVCFVALVAMPAARTSGVLFTADFATLRRALNKIAFSALVVAFLSGVAWLILVAVDILGEPIGTVCLDGGVGTVLMETRFGHIWIVRAALALLLGLTLPFPAMRLLQLGTAASLIGLLALTGHAGAASGVSGQFHLVADVVHVLAAGVWLGGLPALAMLLAKARKASPSTPLVVDATRRFSRFGLVSVAALLASGIANGWFLLSSPADLFFSDYGRLILIKIGLFGAMIGIATVNKFHLTPQLPMLSAMHALQRNSLLETGLGVGVLIAVGVLGALAPPSHRHDLAASVPLEAAYMHFHSNEIATSAAINPAP